MVVAYADFGQIVPYEHGRDLIGVGPLHFCKHVADLGGVKRMFGDGIGIRYSTETPAFVLDVLEMKSFEEKIGDSFEHVGKMTFVSERIISEVRPTGKKKTFLSCSGLNGMLECVSSLPMDMPNPEQCRQSMRRENPETERIIESAEMKIFDGALSDIIEVTYAYTKTGERTFFNRTVFSDFAGVDFSEGIEKAFHEAARKLSEKRADIAEHRTMISALPKERRSDRIEILE